MICFNQVYKRYPEGYEIPKNGKAHPRQPDVNSRTFLP